MTEKETQFILAILQNTYRHAYRNLTQQEANGIITVWQLQFADTPVEIVHAALQKAISNNSYPPTIADVKNKITELHFEAYDIVSYDFNRKNMPAELYQQYERIYEATKQYKVPGMASPTLQQMLANRNMLMLGEGE